MKMPARRLLRTTLLSSTAGVFLGVPLLGGLPTALGGEPLTGPSVIRAQSTPDGGVISRWMGRRAVENAPSTGSPEISDAMAAAPQQDPGMFSRLLGSSDPNSKQSQQQMSRAQQKMFRRNPQLMQMYMMQQQLLLLQQQRKLQQGYEEEGVPDTDKFDSLSIDPNEWSDAPGRQITESLPQPAASKPWWETGEKPVNARRRELELDDLPSTPPAPAVPIAESTPAAAAAIADPFPAETPNITPPLPESAPAPQATSRAVPVNRPAPAIAAPDDFGLTFPSDAPAATAAPAPAPVPPEPAAATAVKPVPAAPVAPAFAEPTSAPPFVEASTPEMKTAQAPPAPGTAPSTLEFAPTAPTDFVPPAPSDAVPFTAPASSPASPQQDANALPFPAPASPATEVIPPALAAPELAAEPSTPLAPAPAEVAPLDDAFMPAAPATVDSLPADTAPAEFPMSTAETTPAQAAPFIPDLPVEFGSPSSETPAVAAEPAAPAAEMSTPEGDSPYSGLKLDDAPFLPVPGTTEPSTSEPEMPAFAEPAVPSPAPAEIPAESATPSESSDPDPSYQFAPQPAVAVPNPAPFIPPEPDDFGGTFANSVPQAAPGVGEPRKIVANLESSLPQPNPEEFIAPDVTAWSPEPMQAPDPIVAPSTARQLVAAPAPSPRETQSKVDRISARRGLSGFKGFCPVALKDHRELLDAKPEYSAVYNGRRYFFSSAAAQALFEGNPDQYIPAAMGSDVVHLMLTGEQAAGSLEHAVWFRSKLYMFATAETMETFVAAPSIHARDE